MQLWKLQQRRRAMLNLPKVKKWGLNQEQAGQT